MKITKTITKWIAGAALGAALLFAAPTPKADAQVSFGIAVGRPYYGYGYYHPYYRPYYGYYGPAYYGGYGYYGHPYFGGYYGYRGGYGYGYGRGYAYRGGYGGYRGGYRGGYGGGFHGRR